MDYKSLYYTISTNITYLDKFPAQIIKSKLKSFILNHNLFYIDPRVNSYEKIKDILRKTIICAYLKIKMYLDKVLLNTLSGHEKMIATKIIESLIDCSIAVYHILDPNNKNSVYDVTKDIYELFLKTFLEKLFEDKTTKGKSLLYFILKNQIKEANFDFWMNQHSDSLKIVF